MFAQLRVGFGTCIKLLGCSGGDGGALLQRSPLLARGLQEGVALAAASSKPGSGR